MASYILRYHLSPGGWRDLPLTAGQVSIGSGPQNSLVLKVPQVAPQHALLQIDARGVAVAPVSPQFPVFIEGQPIAAQQWVWLAPGQSFSLGGVTLRVDPITAPAARRPTSRLLPMGLGALFVCACLAFSGLALGRFLPGLDMPVGLGRVDMPPAASESTVPEAPATPQPRPTLAPPKVVAVLPVGPGGEVKDEAGASLSLPPDVISPTLQASLTVSQVGGELAAHIDEFYQIESYAYAVSAAESPGPGRPSLRIPAGGPDSRLAVLVDNRYLGVLDVTPQDGQFVIDPFLGAPQAPSQYPSLGSGEQANQYLVLTPRPASSSRPDSSRTFGLAMPALADEDGRSCVAERFTLNHCWRNPESSVYIFWRDDYPAELKNQEYLRAIETIKAVAAIMQAYQAQGFAHAAISSSYRVDVVIDAGVSEPFYSPRSHNLYLPWDIVSNINEPSNRCTLAHELFHWIEDEEYRMLAAYYSHAKSWWLETAAENGTFMLDTACIEKNLVSYGKVETEENMLAFQSRPLVWAGGEGARYLHAQQLYLSLCPGPACAMSREAFVQAINTGAYPMEGSALAAYEGAASDMARYLLGAAPLSVRSDAFIPPSATSGQSYGDYVVLKKTTKGFGLESGMTASQFKKTSDQEVKIEATIQRGGVYPLWISNGRGTPYAAPATTGLPGVLKVEPGPAFWAKIDDQEPVLYQGDVPVVLGAISDQVGIGRLRIAAYAPTKDEVFRASLGVADLSGDWISARPPEFVFKSQNCGEDSEGFDSLKEAEADPFLTIISGLGTFVRDPAAKDGSRLVWQASQEVPEGAQIQAEVTLKAEAVELTYRVDIPKAEGDARLDAPPSGWLAAAGRPPGAWSGLYPAPGGPPDAAAWGTGWLLLAGLTVGGLGLVRLPVAHRRWLPALALLTLSTALLAGCIGFTFYGTIEGHYTFKKLEALDPQRDPAGANPAVWKLSDGTGSINLDLMMVTTVVGEDLEEVTQESPCQASIEFKPEVFIGPADMVTLPQE